MNLARTLRIASLNRAREYRTLYLWKRHGFYRRMLRLTLEQAREYRAAERMANQSEQRAA